MLVSGYKGSRTLNALGYDGRVESRQCVVIGFLSLGKNSVVKAAEFTGDAAGLHQTAGAAPRALNRVSQIVFAGSAAPR